MPQARAPEAQPTTAPVDKPAPAAPVAPTVGIPTIETDGTGSGPGNAGMAHDLSPWSMFLAADILVKAVIVSLIAASLLTWTILIGKTIELGLAKRRLSRDLEQASAATSLEEARGALKRRGGVFGGLIAAAEREIEVSAVASVDKAGIKERCESLFSERVRLETQGLRRGMGTLATIGAISPFVGLFGTVWGIMNAFIGISKSQTTNLAVVAPGIAEALLATAIGLAAAIPAVIIYNHFSQATRHQQFLVGRASGAVQRLLSRDLDRRAIIHANAAE